MPFLLLFCLPTRDYISNQVHDIYLHGLGAQHGPVSLLGRSSGLMHWHACLQGVMQQRRQSHLARSMTN